MKFYPHTGNTIRLLIAYCHELSYLRSLPTCGSQSLISSQYMSQTVHPMAASPSSNSICTRVRLCNPRNQLRGWTIPYAPLLAAGTLALPVSL